MKSEVCKIAAGGRKTDQEAEGVREILEVVEKTAEDCHLRPKQVLELRLLTEELMGMVRELLGVYEGTFWMEKNGHTCELHVSAKVDASGAAFREKLLGVSTSGKNAAAAGIMGKIRDVVETMIADLSETGAACSVPTYVTGAMGGMPISYDMAWSLEQYRKNVSQDLEKGQGMEAWDELEKSIVANLATDVIVGIKGKTVDLTVIKKFIKNYSQEG